MKKTILLIFCLILISSSAFAYRKGSHPSWDTNTYGHDSYGHLTRNDNLNKDSDGDGVINRYDRNDNNSSKW